MNLSELIKTINKRIDEMDISNIENIEFSNYIDKELQVTNDLLNNHYESYMNELNNLIGLDEVKQDVKKMINYLMFINKTKGQINLENLNLNMIFRGNPGTGKTTVARIIANMLYNLGYAKNNLVIETTPKEFIGEYVGQTAIKSSQLIEKASGGVIFIDEAYTFAVNTDEKGHSYSKEAITEIIKEMEKKNTIFIFAGYDKELDKFIDINPGIKSRIGFDFKFKDYTPNELYEMFINKINASGFKLDNDINYYLLKYITNMSNEKNFGNGRMINNMFDKILLNHATNCSNITDMNRLLMITKEDIDTL